MKWVLCSIAEDFTAQQEMNRILKAQPSGVPEETGTKTQYTEHLMGWGHWIGTTLLSVPS